MNEVGGRNYNVKEKKGMGDLKGEGRTHISLFVAERHFNIRLWFGGNLLRISVQ